MARDNRTLGNFHLDGIPPAPRGVPQVEVTFDIDANGILSRVGEGHGDQQGAEHHDHGVAGLSEAEIEKMVKDAEAHEAEDKERRELVEARNKLDSLIYQSRRC